MNREFNFTTGIIWELQITFDYAGVPQVFRVTTNETSFHKCLCAYIQQTGHEAYGTLDPYAPFDVYGAPFPWALHTTEKEMHNFASVLAKHAMSCLCLVLDQHWKEDLLEYALYYSKYSLPGNRPYSIMIQKKVCEFILRSNIGLPRPVNFVITEWDPPQEPEAAKEKQ